MSIGPTIEPDSVGLTGLVWLFASYGYALYFAANMIGEGSELLLLVPSMAGLVGGVVLPLLGAVPDGAIILFSGLGSIEVAQESLSVGIGALAGSTIMLLTVPWSLSVFAGRVDLRKGKPMYTKKPKLTEGLDFKEELTQTGVAVTKEIRHGGVIMALTTIPYFLIQVPASFLHGPAEEVAKGEHWYALAAFLVCLVGLIVYMRIQLKFSDEGQDKDKRVAICKRALQDGKLSLKGALQANIKGMQANTVVGDTTDGEYSSLTQASDHGQYQPPPAEIAEILKEILLDPFKAYDKDGNNQLEKSEIKVFFHDFHENIDDDEIDTFMKKTDADGDNAISFDEFVTLAYHLIMSSDTPESKLKRQASARNAVADAVFEDDDGEEEEEVPEDITHLSPEEQQSIIKWRAFKMLAIGTVMVIYFSDPMVDVMQEIAVRSGVSPFYVSFVLAPLASNASEFVASMFYAAKKTRKTMTVSLSALEGAACMNNTFCLSIFMFLIYYRGLAWQFTAETISIVIVELIMAILVRSEVMTTLEALGVLMILPLSLVLVATLEYFGFD
mmetsp:Transcript_43007/g.104008  ORF Transcript_43007/g.104008 Transcript_43007/m.104008 type:complete len:557 (+) Transcript_43007:128-1798(+)